MAQRKAVVASSSGLHARPAQLFVQAATETGLPVTIATAGKDPVDARSILSVMGLGVAQGTTVELAAEGDGAEQALDKLVELLETNLDE